MLRRAIEQSQEEAQITAIADSPSSRTDVDLLTPNRSAMDDLESESDDGIRESRLRQSGKL